MCCVCVSEIAAHPIGYFAQRCHMLHCFNVSQPDLIVCGCAYALYVDAGFMIDRSHTKTLSGFILEVKR